MNILKKTLIKIIFLLISLTLVSCGFQLRNVNAIPPELHVMYLQSKNPYGEFESKLKNTFHSLGATFVSTPQAAPIILQLQQTTLSYAPTSIGTSNQATVYNVNYSLQFALLDQRGNIFLPSQTITSTDTMILSANQVVSNNNQLYLLSQQLQRDVITRLIYILGSQQVAEAIQQKHTHDHTRTTRQ